MKVGVFWTQEDSRGAVLARGFVGSCRRAMPGVEIVQLTDDASPVLDGVDAVARLPKRPFALMRVQHQAALAGEWLFVDTDVWVQGDVREVFHAPAFDVAVADRDWPHHPPFDPRFLQAMPYNVGIAFSRSPDFWRAVEAEVLTMPGNRQDWMGDQRAACAVIRSGRFRVRILPGMRYHYPPNTAQDPGLDGAALVHYKGNRKGLMLERIAREAAEWIWQTAEA